MYLKAVILHKVRYILVDALDPIFLKYKALLGEGALCFVEYPDMPPRKEKYKAAYQS